VIPLGYFYRQKHNEHDLIAIHRDAEKRDRA
jgi:hypothetical protein